MIRQAAARSSSVPRQPEPSKTVLIISAETPKSRDDQDRQPERPWPPARPSRTRWPAPGRRPAPRPSSRRRSRTRPGRDPPLGDQVGAQRGYGHCSRWVCCSVARRARSLTTAGPASARASRICSRSLRGLAAPWPGRRRPEWSAPAADRRGDPAARTGTAARRARRSAPDECSAASRVNSAISRWLCSTKRSQPARASTARRGRDADPRQSGDQDRTGAAAEQPMRRRAPRRPARCRPAGRRPVARAGAGRSPPRTTAPRPVRRPLPGSAAGDGQHRVVDHHLGARQRAASPAGSPRSTSGTSRSPPRPDHRGGGPPLGAQPRWPNLGVEDGRPMNSG